MKHVSWLEDSKTEREDISRRWQSLAMKEVCLQYLASLKEDVLKAISDVQPNGKDEELAEANMNFTAYSTTACVTVMLRYMSKETERACIKVLRQTLGIGGMKRDFSKYSGSYWLMGSREFEHLGKKGTLDLTIHTSAPEGCKVTKTVRMVESVLYTSDCSKSKQTELDIEEDKK